MTYTIIDIETTGLSKHRHNITEIAAARMHKGKIVDKFQTLVNPQVKIPRFITRLTGIDNELVKDAPKICEALPDFIKFLGDNVFVAHNATFDYGFLHHNCKTHHDHTLLNEKVCTRKIATRLLPDLHRKRLGDLCEYFDVTNVQAHRAMADVEATAEVFKHMLTKLDDAGIKDPEEIIKFQVLPVRKAMSLIGVERI
ncbi:hypothetical protein HOK51_02725 [Candidatus Woesearchaeota archaeon]|jgi:DNA polymerase III subunit alpha, Gram-positive type|nr:hypothetical protein [Candidatus Woesearchaeota archaeon]MBT6518732.1 hypothetical protein [Candidatus Woesearchaeota archaeon]MBT7367903.1 hypothetical protein [Candidatus Woesearchaeota archaeon]